MTAEVSQTAALVLAETASEARLSQTGVMVLFGVGGSAKVSQVSALILGRPPVRRIVGITD